MSRPTATWRAKTYSTSNSASPYGVVESYTPAANSLLVAFVGSCLASSAPDPTDVSGRGVTFTKIASGINQGTVTLSVWVADAGSSPSAATTAATISGAPTGCVIVEFEVTNWNTAGGAVAAVRQINSATGTATSGSTAVRLVAQTVNESGYLSCYIHLTNETSTGQGGNWTATAGGTGNFNSPATGGIGQHNNTGYTSTATASWSTSSAYVGLVIEIAGTTENTPSESLKITDTVTARLNPDPVNLGNENLKITDTATADIPSTTLSRAVADEGLKLADGGAAAQQGIVQLLGVVHVQDQLTQPVLVGGVGDLSRQISPDEILKLADTVTAVRGLTATIADEALKVQDSVTVDLPLQPGLLLEGLRLNDQPPFIEERLRIVDTVTASFGGADLTRAIADEVLKLADTATVLENPLQTSTLTEALKVQDQTPPLASMGDLVAPVSAEGLNLADGGAAAQRGIVQLLGVIHVQDTVNAVMGTGLIAPVADESLKVQDTVTARLTVLLPSTGALTETIYLDDIGLTAAIGMDEVLHVVDILVNAQLVTTPDLTRQVTDENVKISDAVTVFENPLFAAPAVESLKIQDTFTGSEDPLFAAGASESLKVQDTFTGFENPLFAVIADEGLKVQDQTPLPRLNPQPISVASESLKVSDQTPPGATLSGAGLLQVFVSPDESLKVQDSVTVSENPLFTAGTSESLIVQDSVTVSENPLFSAPAVESLKVQDLVTTFENPLQTSSASESLKVQDQTPPQATLTGSSLLAATITPDEIVKVSDSASTSINPEFAAPAVDSLKVSDSVQAALAVSASVTQEVLKLADTVTAAVGLSALPAQEDLKVSDSVSRTLTLLIASPASESLKVSDVLNLGVDLLSVTIAPENLKLEDYVVVPVTADYRVYVRPRVSGVKVKRGPL